MIFSTLFLQGSRIVSLRIVCGLVVRELVLLTRKKSRQKGPFESLEQKISSSARTKLLICYCPKKIRPAQTKGYDDLTLKAVSNAAHAVANCLKQPFRVSSQRSEWTLLKGDVTTS